jgi:hypothetical protein
VRKLGAVLRYDHVILTKDGFYTEEWDRDKGDYTREKLPLDNHLFFSAWNTTFQIEGPVTLKDFVEILKQMDPLILQFVGFVTGANIEAYLEEDLTPIPDDDDRSELQFIEVYKYYESDNYNIDHWTMESHVSAHGIGGPWADAYPGDETPVEKRGNQYAIEFTPWNKMMHLPIKLKETVNFTTTTYKKREKPRKTGFFDKQGKMHGEGWTSDVEHVGWDNKEVVVTYTLGEFFDGLLDELCFFWTPDVRSEKEQDLKEASEEAKQPDAEFYELKDYDDRCQP